MLPAQSTSSQSGNRTSTEHGALRGFHLTESYSHLTWTVLYGQTAWDASFAPGEPARLIPQNGTLPARGERLRLNLNHRLTTGFSIRFTADSKRASARLPRRSLRISLTYRRPAHRFILWNQIARSGTSGRASGIRLNVGQTTGFSLALWATIHTIASYDARIYDFEPDVWGGTRLLTLSGRGLNRGIRLAWAKKHIRLATRYSYHQTSSWSVQIDLRR